MKRPVTLAGFFARASLWFVLLALGWMQIAAWTSYPAARMAQIVLDSNALDWVQATQNVPGQLKAQTTFRQMLPGNRVSTPIAVVEPAHAAYGTALFFALLLASRTKRFVRRAVGGYAVLLFPQAFSLIFILLGQIVTEVPIQALGIGVWQADAIMVCNVFGGIILPTLAPVVLWLWLESAFVQSLMQDMGFAAMLGVDQRRGVPS